jgi:hypothetical protein
MKTLLGLGLAVLMAAAIACGSDSPAPSPTASLPKYSVAGEQGVFKFVEIEDTSRPALEAVSAKLCANMNICQVIFWRSGAPTRLPMTDAQVAAEVAHYERNTNTGLDQLIICDGRSGC